MQSQRLWIASYLESGGDSYAPIFHAPFSLNARIIWREKCSKIWDFHAKTAFSRENARKITYFHGVRSIFSIAFPFASSSTYISHLDYPHHRSIRVYPLLRSYRGIGICLSGGDSVMDDRYMAAHQRQDELDFLWLLWVLYKNSKETPDRVYLKTFSLFLRVDTCTLFCLWCNEIFEKDFCISEFTASIFFHCFFEFSIFSRTLTSLHG